MKEEGEGKGTFHAGDEFRAGEDGTSRATATSRWVARWVGRKIGEGRKEGPCTRARYSRVTSDERTLLSAWLKQGRDWLML